MKVVVKLPEAVARMTWTRTEPAGGNADRDPLGRPEADTVDRERLHRHGPQHGRGGGCGRNRGNRQDGEEQSQPPHTGKGSARQVGRHGHEPAHLLLPG